MYWQSFSNILLFLFCFVLILKVMSGIYLIWLLSRKVSNVKSWQRWPTLLLLPSGDGGGGRVPGQLHRHHVGCCAHVQWSNILHCQSCGHSPCHAARLQDYELWLPQGRYCSTTGQVLCHHRAGTVAPQSRYCPTTGQVQWHHSCEKCIKFKWKKIIISGIVPL